MNDKNILVFVNGKLLSSYEYYLADGCIKFKDYLNSTTQVTFTDIIIVCEGVKIYEKIISAQNVSEIDLILGEVR